MARIDKLFELIDSLKVDGIIITSYSNIFYYSNFTSEDSILYINKDNAYLITDSRYTIQASKQARDFKVITRNGSYANELAKLIKGGRVLFEDSIIYNFYMTLVNSIKANFTSINIDHLRNIKEEKEVRCIKEACKIASKCYKHILGYVKPNMKESEIANEMLHYMKSLGASKESFETIVASGKRGALPHGVASEKRVKEGEFITLDFGCIYKGYCSDITRSFMLGKANKKMIEIYNVVKEAQSLAIKEVKEGVKASYIDSIARNYIESKGYGQYFTHSTGHGVGVVVHDPIAVSKNSDLILKENMVITVEPGIYIPEFGGIRIEDDVLVTKDGCKILTRASKRLISVK
jgi:Xaa-Pro aminopeptidase